MHCKCVTNTSSRVFAPIPPPLVSCPTPVVNIDAAPDSAIPLQLVGSITYDREEGSYNLEWESRADFQSWLTHEQKALGIEIQIATVRLGYLGPGNKSFLHARLSIARVMDA